MANSSIDLISLDFDTLKAQFITFLQTQEQFKDYNYDASAMNVLLDILAYNTYKNSFYTNMVFAEGFIDSAQLRESLFSHSKELNYLPRSAKSAAANVSISFTASGESQPYLIRKGQTFTSVIKQDTYVFSVGDDVLLTSSNNSFSASFPIYEGFYTNDTYVVDYTVPFQAFSITNQNVDTDSLTVLVYEDGSSVPVKYSRATTLLGLNEQSRVYFIQPTFKAGYDVIFGDGVLGRKPKNGATVVLDYRVTNGPEANGARSFSINFDPTGSGELTSTVAINVGPFSATTRGSYSVGGADAESNDSIKFYAPRHFQTQERAVTVSDYEIALKTEFPEINAVSVYGGEEVSPPRYGKVFVAVDIKNVEGLPDAKITEYYNFLKSRSPLSIDPLFTEPEFTYVNVNSLVKYNINVTTKTTQNIKAATILTVSEFAEQFLNDFKSSLRYSKLTSAIDNIDQSIISNQTDLRMYKKIRPTLATSQNFDINFNTPLEETDYVSDEAIGTVAGRHKVRSTRTLQSSYFVFNGEKCIIEDDGAGVVRIVKEEGEFHYIVRIVGTIDYKTGMLKLVNFSVDSYEGNAIKIYVHTKEKDILGQRNEILSIESDEINVTVEAVRE